MKHRAEDRLSVRQCCAWVALLTALVGCAADNVYIPTDLPSHLQAPPVENIQTVDLTRLSGYAVSNELIEPGDVLEISMVSGYSDKATIKTPVRVGDNGTANVPLVGQVSLAGLELVAAEGVIASAAYERGIYKNPHVTVVMERKRVNKVTVIGAVEKPGTYELARASSDLLSALVAAGGFSEEAGTTVDIRSPARELAPGAVRGDVTAGMVPGQQVAYQQQVQPARSVRIDLIAASRSEQAGVSLGDGDVISVQKRDPKPVHVMGLVRKPGQYEMPPNKELSVLDAVAMAGGISSNVANKIFVIRRVPGQTEAAVIKVQLDRAKRNGIENVRLASGDIVAIEQTPATIIYDAMKSFMRFGFSSSVALF